MALFIPVIFLTLVTDMLGFRVHLRIFFSYISEWRKFWTATINTWRGWSYSSRGCT